PKKRRDPCGGGRSEENGRRATQLAVPTGSADRQLRSDHQQVHRLMARASRQSPSKILFPMPAEWKSHAATWLAWPHNRADWPGKFQPIGWVMAEIIRHVAQVELVH